ncbi:MAG: hypothetical protein NC905_00970 [Candidatus Omnitrophica bacterium]|nr:hypothetical protein [Candidatus Omnitrophota bacterium]MCM8776828.1 hypothetical protein [Candidatus Omnitrophota bacterium]
MKKLAFIGTNEGNGHIFSWSAIINGRYDRERMKNCGYPVIPEYLSKDKILGPGIRSVTNLGDKNINVVYIEYNDDRKAVIENIYNSKILGYDIITPENTYTIKDTYWFYMFKKQMETFVRFIDGRIYPYPYEETIEITKVIIAGIISREEQRKVELKEI